MSVGVSVGVCVGVSADVSVGVSVGFRGGSADVFVDLSADVFVGLSADVSVGLSAGAAVDVSVSLSVDKPVGLSLVPRLAIEIAIPPLMAHEPCTTIHLNGGGRNAHIRCLCKAYTDSITTWMICLSTLPIFGGAPAVSTDLHGIPRLFPRRSMENRGHSTGYRGPYLVIRIPKVEDISKWHI